MLYLLIFVFLLYSPQATTAIPCDATALNNALTTANSNNQVDTLQLAANCTYTLPTTATIQADNGNRLTLIGDNTTINTSTLVLNALSIAPNAQVNIDGLTFAPRGISIDVNANVTISQSLFDGQATTPGYGVQNQGTTTITATTFTGYTLRSAIENYATLTLNAVTCTANHTQSGACVDNRQSLNINGGDYHDNSAQSNGGAIKNNGTINMTGASLRDNSANDHGGALYSVANTGQVTIDETVFSGNTAGDFGGAIANDGHIITVNTSTLTNNTGTNGGAIASWRSNSATQGAQTQISRSTLNDNTATADGGALYLDDTSSVTLTTLTANTAQNGGAIAIYQTTAITHSTIVSNQATGNGGGLYLNTPERGLFHHNIVSENSGTQPNVAGSTVDNAGYNMIGDPFGSQFASTPHPTDIVNAPANLHPLADNGGPTATMHPRNDSLILDAGSCTGVSVDQRGQARVVDLPPFNNVANGCDIGAVEAQTLPGIACLDGNAADNTIICAENLPNTGNDANFEGAGGADVMTLNAGVSINGMYGGDGDDTLIVNGSANSGIFGGAGDDTFILREWITTTTINGGDGDDHLIMEFNSATQAEIRDLIAQKRAGNSVIFRSQTLAWAAVERVTVRMPSAISEQELQVALLANIAPTNIDFILIDLRPGGAWVTVRAPDGTTHTLLLQITTQNGLMQITYDDIPPYAADLPRVLLAALDDIHQARFDTADLQVIALSINALTLNLSVQH